MQLFTLPCILSLLAVFFLGFLLGIICQQYRVYKNDLKKQRRRVRPDFSPDISPDTLVPRPPQKSAQRRFPKHKEPSAPVYSVPRPPHQPVSQKMNEVSVQLTPEKAVPYSDPVSEEDHRKHLEHLYRNFCAVEFLNLRFNCSIPEGAHFIPGKDYILNSRNELLPEQSCVLTSNTLKGYASSGLLWVFDAQYQGKQYTYNQILDNTAYAGYVQICDVIAPVILQDAAHGGTRILVKKGLLQFTSYT